MVWNWESREVKDAGRSHVYFKRSLGGLLQPDYCNSFSLNRLNAGFLLEIREFTRDLGCNREFMTLPRQQKLKYLLLYNTIFLHEVIRNCFFPYILIFEFWPSCSCTRIARVQCISKITRGTLDQSAERLDSNNTPYMSTEVLCVEVAFHRG